MINDLLHQRSKQITFWLRHKPERAGISLSGEGWADIPELLEAFVRAEDPLTREEFDNVVRLDQKKRFEVDGDRIRARYGHSLELDVKPHPGKPPAVIYHGTSKRYISRIMEKGLLPVKRQYVHLSPDKQDARSVGTRRDQEPVILQIAAHEAYDAGVQFYPRGKGVWMSDAIPPEFLQVLEEPANLDSDRKTPGEPRRRRPKGGFTINPVKNNR